MNLPWIRRRNRTLPAQGRRPPPPATADDGSDDERCCGWLDSSQDLRRGLAVIEYPALDLDLTLGLLVGPDVACALQRQASRPAR